jgi:AbrB family looped-hinge helix DNA binding protein
MNALTVTAKGQITLKKDFLMHLGIHPGDRISIDKMPGGEIRIRAEKPVGSIAEFCGFLKQDGQRPISIEEMNEVIAKGWAGEL